MRENENRRGAAFRRPWIWAALILVLVCAALIPALRYIPARTPQKMMPSPELSRRFSQNLNHLLDGELGEHSYVKKHYRIPSGSLPAAPAPGGFGATDDPQVVLALIESASDLLGEEQITAWTPETELRPGSEVRWYYDETILVLTWQELSNQRICTYCEVVLADASQLRRKLAGDRYGYPIQMTASELAAQDNAVAAVSGDFYAFRSAGLYVYQGMLYNVDGDMADTLMVTTDGDMLVVPLGKITTWNQAWAYFAEHDIAFSLAFGPTLVMNGENVTPWYYPWGEIDTAYARAAISQLGHLHYLFLAANCDVNQGRRFLGTEIADLMIAHGCEMAYALDGGQTAEVILGGALVNRPEFGYERQVSDILCFASALPEGETG